MSDNGTIILERDADGIVTLTLDAPDKRVNTMSEAFCDDLRATLERVEAERDEIAGIILTSAKSTFFAGGDINELLHVDATRTAEFAEFVASNSASLRALEKIGKPVVAAIAGSALGGGLELALAAHHRIAVDDPRIRLGFPEVTLGLLPGAGGVVRSVRMLGVEKALSSLLLEGKPLRVQAAQELGLIGEVVGTAGELVPAAKRWIAANPEGPQPWDAPGYLIPGGVPGDRSQPLNAMLPALPATLRKKLKGANYPAPQNILAAAVEGSQVDVDSALRVESRYFVDLATGQIAKNMIKAFFFDTQQVAGNRGRAADREPWRAGKVAVLGAGMMGAAIAYECARAGIEVVLKDISAEQAEKGKDYSRRLVAKAVKSGRSTQEKADALLARINPTGDAADAAGADLVIEAVFEDPSLKAKVLAEIEPHLAPGALVGSNTSTLPITGLADTVADAGNFIGLHFFSPVDKMPLLEIIKGAKTSADSLSRALDLAKQISKTPIVVNDSRGFFTSRVIGTFINEALAILGEGVPAPTIEQASSQAGYPAPALQLTDELNLELIRRVRDASKAAAEEAGGTWNAHPAEAVVDRMLSEYDRRGRLGGAGFYDYDADGRRQGLWTGLTGAFGGTNAEVPFVDVRERMLFAEALESVRCLEENVIESIADANVGSILGIGFPGWTGGVLQYIDGYDGGVAGFVNRARELAAAYGARFVPSDFLVELAARGGTLASAHGDSVVGRR